MYDVDVVWHTHQLHPVAYAADMTSILGYVMNHDDTDQSRKSGSKLNNVSDQYQCASVSAVIDPRYPLA